MEQTSRMNEYVASSLATREKYRKELLDIIGFRFWYIFDHTKAKRISIEILSIPFYKSYRGVVPEIKGAYKSEDGDLLLDMEIVHQVIRGMVPKTLGTEILEVLAHTSILSAQNMDNGDVFFFDNNEFVNPKITTQQ